MSNWEYANQVPTKVWRNAMTIPRELNLKQADNGLLLTSQPVAELKNTYTTATELKNLQVNKSINLSSKVKGFESRYMLKLRFDQLNSYAVRLSNGKSEALLIGYDAANNQYFIDRTKAGKTDFQKDFAGRFTAPRLTAEKSADLTLVVDKASVEVFADGGLTVMTAIYFPNSDFNNLAITSAGMLKVSSLKLTGLHSIWK
jgi:fructan beta-fructosidase